jgi:hypothetical protein
MGIRRAAPTIPYGAEKAPEGQPLPPAPVIPGRMDGWTAEKEIQGPLGDVYRLIAEYMILPPEAITIITAYVGAIYLLECWDIFPVLALMSPEMRCGKTRLLKILKAVVPFPEFSPDVTPAWLFRAIEAGRKRGEPLTLLFDEAHMSLGDKRDAMGQALRKLLQAGIEVDAVTGRCEPGINKRFSPKSFSIYGAKILAMIGRPHPILADRCIPVYLNRAHGTVATFDRKLVEDRGREIREKLHEWAKEKEELASTYYTMVSPLPIRNSRMAELLLPLQVVLWIAGGCKEGCESINQLKKYADAIDNKDAEQDSQSLATLLLSALREIFTGFTFRSSGNVIDELNARKEEPWETMKKGRGINEYILSSMLRKSLFTTDGDPNHPIKPRHNSKRTMRGYWAEDFAYAWSEYLPPADPLPCFPSPSGSSIRPDGPGSE